MDIISIIRGNLPEGVVLNDKAIGTIAKEIKSAQGKEFVPMEQYSLKTRELGEIETEMADLRAKASQVDSYKTKYETEVEAHKQTKTAIETEKALNAKKSALHRQLAADGANPKLLKLLEKEFDIANLEIDGEGDAAKIKGWDTLSKSVKEQYADVFGKVETTGANVSNPPPARETKPATNKDMNSFIRGTL